MKNIKKYEREISQRETRTINAIKQILNAKASNTIKIMAITSYIKTNDVGNQSAAKFAFSDKEK